MQMLHWLEKRASLTPNRIACIEDQSSLTFGELRDSAQALARKLGTLGIKKGGYVALLCQNGIHVPQLIHAIHYAGAVLVPLNIRLTAHELTFQLHDAGCQLLLYDDAMKTLSEEVSNEADVKTVGVNELLAAAEAEVSLQTYIDMNDVHTIMYTSGTTGNPKGVMLTFENHWSSAIGSALNLGLTEQDRWLACVPLFHVSGLSILMRSVIYGMPVIIHRKFDPDAANHAIMEEGVTVVSVVSATLKRMMDAIGENQYPTHFRCMLLGGGPAPQPLLETCRDKGIPVFQTYGMTETASQIVTLSPEYMLSKLGSAGKPLFQSELRIEVEGKEAAPSEAGEIVVRGPNVTKGYLNRPDATHEAIKDGWLYTGDIGYVDEDGFLYVLDRRKDLIISGGENVYPAEIESALLAHPAIVEAGVTGMEDVTWGQVPVAFVKVREGVTLSSQAVLTYCSLKLAKYKVPAKVVFVDELPRNASNKLLRRELSKLLKQ